MKNAAGKTARARAWRLATLALAILPFIALARAWVGNTVSFESSLRIVNPAPLSNFAPNLGNTKLEAVAPGFWATLGGFFVFCGEATQQLGPRGILPFFGFVLLACGAWFGLAVLGEWRKPPVAFMCLVALQLFGALYYFSSFRAPARKLSTPFTTFDFHTHTTYSSGLLTPQQQIDWHRARGFSGLAFTDSDLMIPTSEFAALVASNPDMKLLNGSEYHGATHLILLGIKSAISSKQFDVAGAIREAKKQGGIVIAAHPWDARNKLSPEKLAALGVDGFEAWNGRVQSESVLRAAKSRRLVATAATDTLSKSGSHCFTWALLPRGLDSSAKVMRALRLKKVAAAVTLDGDNSPAAYDARVAKMKKIGAPISASRAAWQTLSRAQKLATLLTSVALVSLAWAWGAERGRRPIRLAGPQRAVGFLRRRRWLGRVPGMALMALAWLGSIGAAIFALSWTDKLQIPGLTPLHAIFAWFALDALYLYGRSLWHRAV